MFRWATVRFPLARSDQMVAPLRASRKRALQVPRISALAFASVKDWIEKPVLLADGANGLGSHRLVPDRLQHIRERTELEHGYARLRRVQVCHELLRRHLPVALGRFDLDHPERPVSVQVDPRRHPHLRLRAAEAGEDQDSSELEGDLSPHGASFPEWMLHRPAGCAA
jgi:hypothetical protein